MSLRHAITRTVVAVPMGAVALGEAKDPGHISDVMADLPLVNEIPLYHSAIEGAGNLMTQHQNPTVAFFGLMAIAVAVNHGPLFNFKTVTKSFTGKSPFRQRSSSQPLAQKVTGVQMKTANITNAVPNVENNPISFGSTLGEEPSTSISTPEAPTWQHVDMSRK